MSSTHPAPPARRFVDSPASATKRAPQIRGCSSPPPPAPSCIPCPASPVPSRTPAEGNDRDTPRTAFPNRDRLLLRTSNTHRSHPRPDRLQSHTFSRFAPATRSSPARCRAFRRVRSDRVTPPQPSPGQIRIPPMPGNKTPGPRQIPAPQVHATMPTVSGAMRSAPASARDGRIAPVLAQTAEENPLPAQPHRLDRPTMEKSDADNPYPLPAATPRRKALPLHSPSTPAQSPHSAPVPIARKQAPLLLAGPTVKPRNNADSESCALAPRSLPLKPGNTRCQYSETPTAGRCDARFVNGLSATPPEGSPRTAGRSGKYPPPIPGSASLACSECRLA